MVYPYILKFFFVLNERWGNGLQHTKPIKLKNELEKKEQVKPSATLINNFRFK